MTNKSMIRCFRSNVKKLKSSQYYWFSALISCSFRLIITPFFLPFSCAHYVTFIVTFSHISLYMLVAVLIQYWQRKQRCQIVNFGVLPLGRKARTIGLPTSVFGEIVAFPACQIPLGISTRTRKHTDACVHFQIMSPFTFPHGFLKPLVWKQKKRTSCG